LPDLVFAYPGRLETPTGGYEYDRQVVAALRRAGRVVRLLALGDGFPFPAAKVSREALERVRALPSHTPLIIDGLALGALDGIGAALPDGTRLVALVHHPLALETGLDPGAAGRLHESESRALAAASAIVVTSHATAATLRQRFGIDPARLFVAPPGTLPAETAIGSGTAAPNLLAVGTLSPRKGHDLLVAALADLAALPWSLRIVGDATLHSGCAAALREQIAAAGLQDRIALTGALDRDALEDEYRLADIFALASHYEGYGMAYAEALAHGLPVIGTQAGAIPEVVPPDCGLLVPPGDVAALRDALHTMMTDSARRTRYAAGARAAAVRLPTWDQAATIFAAILGDDR
jgi:glycosyltransferase involved in cell wall biosynthesis